MQEKQKQFLRTLCETVTPSGFELAGQRVVASYLEAHADSIKLDSHCNLICVLNPDAKRRVMIDGHVDEVGFLVQHIDDNGFIYVSPIGGINLQSMPGKRVVFMGPQGRVPGVIGRKAIHLMSAAEREAKFNDISEFWIDIGAKNAAEAAELAPLGSHGVIDAGWRELRNGLVACRGFDDKSGVYVAAEAFRILAERRAAGRGPKVGVYFLSGTQEEIGLLGGKTAGFGIDPHASVSVDVMCVSDFPGGADPKQISEIKLGAGPVITMGPVYDKGLNAHIADTAKKSGIAVQLHSRAVGADTFAWYLHTTRAGVSASLISIPLRSGHSGIETLSLDDLDNCAQLVADAVEALPEDFDFTPEL